MIGPSDLNRIPRWAPERQTEELRRYARFELGGEIRAWDMPVSGAQPLRGIRLRLSSHLSFARSAREATPAGPLRSNRAAVHFLGEPQAVSGQSREPSAETAAVFATGALAFCARAHDDCADETLACNR